MIRICSSKQVWRSFGGDGRMTGDVLALRATFMGPASENLHRNRHRADDQRHNWWLKVDIAQGNSFVVCKPLNNCAVEPPPGGWLLSRKTNALHGESKWLTI